MIKKLVKHGNSSALIIDKPIIEMLHIDENTNLELSTDGVNIIISPVSGTDRTNMLRNSLGRINDKHSKTLKKLAK
ncbi:MAG: AbrB/MazE/SpoVT family DNA-binding domain-containing protein [Candidatus Delongbacteria bacterium]|nr:AbrB/MazE/SpoVT family DNA-binding domain-containing protein [Candidatus Delongbacteria bacterium]MCG2761470.1 AbrB/MazE/SpoVT family DNA-binding domain-containing protein [Candidatus Delongbacteria bacterium]